MPLGIGEYPLNITLRCMASTARLGTMESALFCNKCFTTPQDADAADTKLADVKLGQLGSWFGRRSYNPMAMFRVTGRAYWRWAEKWLMVKKPTVAPVAHIILGLSLFYYIQLYSFVRYHRHTKYHW